MSSPYASARGSGSGSRYGRAGGSGGGRRRKKDDGVSVFGAVGNLAEDVGDAIVGIPAGLVATVRDPIETAKAIASSYAATYGPLLRGDIGTFARGVYEHPLGPLLDLAAVVTLGAGATARAGLLPVTTRRVSLRGPGARDGDPAGMVLEGRMLSRNPVIQARQRGVDRTLKALPYETPVIGELARFGRELRRSSDVKSEGLRLKMADYTRAFGDLSSKERIALGVLGRLPLEKHLDSWKEILADSARRDNEGPAGQLLELLADEKVMNLYREPSEKMLRAHKAADELAAVSAEVLGARGSFTPERAQQARYRHSRLAAGAVAYSPAEARRTARTLERDIRRLDRQQQTLERLIGRTRKGTPELRQVRREAGKTATAAARAVTIREAVVKAGDKVEQLQTELAGARERLERFASGREISSDELLAAGIKPGSDFELLRTRLVGREFDKVTRLAVRYDRALVDLSRQETRIPDGDELAGRQSAELEQYQAARQDLAGRLQAGRLELERLAELEERLAEKRDLVGPGIVGGPAIDELQAEIEAAGRPLPLYLPDTAIEPRRGGRGRGRTATSAPRNPAHRSEGVLFRLGQLALEPDVLGPEFLRTVVYAHYLDLHDALLEASTRLARGRGLPAGHVWVKRPVGARQTSERIGYVESTRGEHQASLAELIGKPEEAGNSELARRGFTSASESEALQQTGFRFAVPEQLARQLTSEFRQTTKAVQLLLEKPTSVWRALVLGLRPAFLVNNIVGNHLLYALRFAGPAGLRAYYDTVASTKGPRAARRLLEDRETRNALTAADLAEIFPEQASGTFIGTQLLTGKTGRLAKKASLGLIPADRAAEAGLRRAAVNASLRRSPEVKARLKTMPKETRSFRAAAKQELEQNPALARQVSDQVNAALGDYFSLTDTERVYVRRALPFYAWYRAITLIVLKLPLDAPARADLLAKVGELGAEQTRAALGELPSFLEGALPLGDDRILKTTGVNPPSTVLQIGTAARALAPGADRENALAALGMSNPFLAAIASQLVSASTGGRSSIGFGLPGAVGATVGESLPFTRLARAARGDLPRKLYEPSLQDELLAYLGLPVKTVNRRVARQYAAEGR